MLPPVSIEKTKADRQNNGQLIKQFEEKLLQNLRAGATSVWARIPVQTPWFGWQSSRISPSGQTRVEVWRSVLKENLVLVPSAIFLRVALFRPTIYIKTNTQLMTVGLELDPLLTLIIEIQIYVTAAV